MKLWELYECRAVAVACGNRYGYNNSREIARWDAAIEARIIFIGSRP